MSEIDLTEKELAIIIDVVNRIEIGTVTLKKETYGIGYTLTAEFPIEHCGIKGKFAVDITSSDNW